MKYKLRYMDLALRDIADIKVYLSGFYPGTWPRFTEKLKSELFGLESMPFMYPSWRSDSDYRYLAVNEYLVFYKVYKSDKTIHIHRILHGARDIRHYLEVDVKIVQGFAELEAGKGRPAEEVFADLDRKHNI